MPAGTGVAALPMLALTALAGVALGLGGYTFVYAQGSAYLTDDPAACANCHVMRQQFEGWQKGPHHHVAVCNDCHVPSGPVARVATKLQNGWHHSTAFTSGDYPDAILIRDASRRVVEGRCKTCHSDLIAAMGGPEVSCIRCHDSVGHLR